MLTTAYELLQDHFSSLKKLLSNVEPTTEEDRKVYSSLVGLSENIKKVAVEIKDFEVNSRRV
ncbi:MAG: hypothetical protein N2645_17780 [Clostridia bacterium]|nr:hypothetical protein [Clostridia bacterium]